MSADPGVPAASPALSAAAAWADYAHVTPADAGAAGAGGLLVPTARRPSDDSSVAPTGLPRGPTPPRKPPPGLQLRMPEGAWGERLPAAAVPELPADHLAVPARMPDAPYSASPAESKDSEDSMPYPTNYADGWDAPASSDRVYPSPKRTGPIKAPSGPGSAANYSAASSAYGADPDYNADGQLTLTHRPKPPLSLSSLLSNLAIGIHGPNDMMGTRSGERPRAVPYAERTAWAPGAQFGTGTASQPGTGVGSGSATPTPGTAGTGGRSGTGTSGTPTPTMWTGTPNMPTAAATPPPAAPAPPPAATAPLRNPAPLPALPNAAVAALFATPPYPSPVPNGVPSGGQAFANQAASTYTAGLPVSQGGGGAAFANQAANTYTAGLPMSQGGGAAFASQAASTYTAGFPSTQNGAPSFAPQAPSNYAGAPPPASATPPAFASQAASTYTAGLPVTAAPFAGQASATYTAGLPYSQIPGYPTFANQPGAAYAPGAQWAGAPAAPQASAYSLAMAAAGYGAQPPALQRFNTQPLPSAQSAPQLSRAGTVPPPGGQGFPLAAQSTANLSAYSGAPAPAGPTASSIPAFSGAPPPLGAPFLPAGIPQPSPLALPPAMPGTSGILPFAAQASSTYTPGMMQAQSGNVLARSGYLPPGTMYPTGSRAVGPGPSFASLAGATMATLGGSTMSGALAGGAPLKPRIKSSQILVSSSAPLLPPSATNGAVVGRGVRSTDAGLVCPACLAHNPAGVPGCLACGSAFALPLPAPERPKSRGANSQSGDSIARAKSSGTGFSDRAGATLPPGFGAAVPTGSRSGGIAGGMKTLPPGIGLPGMPSPNVGAVQAQQAQQQAQQAQGQPPGGYAQPQPQYAAYQQQMQGYPQMQMQMGMQGGYYGQQLQAGQQAGRY